MSTFRKYCPGLILYLLIGAWLLHFILPVHYSLQVSRVKAEQRRVIRTRNREHDTRHSQLSLAVAKFKQVCDGNQDEILLDGEMYDLVSYKVDGDTVRCLVLKDDEESELHKEFGKDIGRKHRPTSKPLSFFWLFAFGNKIELPVAPVFMPLDPNTPETHDKPSCGYRRFISQPPELA